MKNFFPFSDFHAVRKHVLTDNLIEFINFLTVHSDPALQNQSPCLRFTGCKFTKYKQVHNRNTVLSNIILGQLVVGILLSSPIPVNNA